MYFVLTFLSLLSVTLCKKPPPLQAYAGPSILVTSHPIGVFTDEIKTTERTPFPIEKIQCTDGVCTQVFNVQEQTPKPTFKPFNIPNNSLLKLHVSIKKYILCQLKKQRSCVAHFKNKLTSQFLELGTQIHTNWYINSL